MIDEALLSSTAAICHSRHIEGSQLKHILLIDRDTLFTRLFARFLRQQYSHKVSVFSGGNDAMEEHCRHPADLVITQFPIPEKGTRRFIAELKEYNPEVKVIALSAHREFTEGRNSLWQIRRLGVCRWFSKPFVTEDIIAAIEEELGALSLSLREPA